MTFLVFCGVLVSLLVLRSIPGLMLRLFLAIPKHRLIATLRAGRRIAIVLPRRKTSIAANTALATAGGRVRLVLVSSSLLMLALLATTAFWSHHTASLMILLP